MTSPKENQVFELAATPLTAPLPPPKSIYRAYATSEPESDSDRSTLVMSSPQVPKMSPPRPIIHQRPLVLRSKQPPSPPAPTFSTANPPVQYQTPSILSPTPTLVATPSGSAPSPSIPSRGPRATPLPSSANPISTPKSSNSRPPPTLSPSKSTRTLTPPLDLTPTKSLRQKAFERAQSPSPAQGHNRKKSSTGQRMKEGAFFAFVLLPMSCWYTRGGKFGGPGQALKGSMKIQDDDDDDNDSMDSRAPRLIAPPSRGEGETMQARTPTMTRRMSEGAYQRRDSFSRMPTLTRTNTMGRRESFDGSGSVARERSNVTGRRESFDGKGSMTRERSNTMSRREEPERMNSMTRERPNTPGKRVSFDGKVSTARERSNTMERRQSLDRTGSLTRKDWPQPPMMPMQRAAGNMTRREWEWEREQDRRRENASFNGNRIMSMGMPPPVMVAERWV